MDVPGHGCKAQYSMDKAVDFIEAYHLSPREKKSTNGDIVPRIGVGDQIHGWGRLFIEQKEEKKSHAQGESYPMNIIPILPIIDVISPLSPNRFQ